MSSELSSLPRNLIPGSTRSAARLRLLGPIGVIARVTVLEVWRARLPAVLVLLPMLLLGLASFAGELALTETSALRASLVAPLARLMVVAALGAYAIGILNRELSDRGIEIVFGAPVSRIAWACGRWLGMSLIGLALAMSASIAIGALAPIGATLAWTFSLWMETILVAGACLSLCVAIRQFAAALLALACAYVLARLIGIATLLAHRSPAAPEQWFGLIGRWFLDALSHLLPRLDLFTRTEWLVAASLPVQAWQASALAHVLLQTIVYCALMLAVVRLDLGRRDD